MFKRDTVKHNAEVREVTYPLTGATGWGVRCDACHRDNRAEAAPDSYYAQTCAEYHREVGADHPLLSDGIVRGGDLAGAR